MCNPTLHLFTSIFACVQICLFFISIQFLDFSLVAKKYLYESNSNEKENNIVKKGPNEEQSSHRKSISSSLEILSCSYKLIVNLLVLVYSLPKGNISLSLKISSSS